MKILLDEMYAGLKEYFETIGYEVLTTEEATEYLKISKPTYLKYIRLGRIRAIKAGKGWRVLHSELKRFLGGEVKK